MNRVRTRADYLMRKYLEYGGAFPDLLIGVDVGARGAESKVLWAWSLGQQPFPVPEPHRQVSSSSDPSAGSTLCVTAQW